MSSKFDGIWEVTELLEHMLFWQRTWVSIPSFTWMLLTAFNSSSGGLTVLFCPVCPQSLPPPWHPSSNKVTSTPTRPHLLRCSLPRGQAFKHTNLWGPNLFRPAQTLLSSCFHELGNTWSHLLVENYQEQELKVIFNVISGYLFWKNEPCQRPSVISMYS